MKIINHNAHNNLSYSVKHIITNYNILSVCVTALFSLTKSGSGLERMLNVTELDFIIDNVIGRERFYDYQIPKAVGEFLVSGAAYSLSENDEFGVSVQVGDKHKILIKNKSDTNRIEGFGPYPLNPSTPKLLGDIDFKQKVIMLPKDVTFKYFNIAPLDQRLPGFFHGDEKIIIKNMHPDLPIINTSLPDLRLRMFVMYKNDYGEDGFKEMSIQADTLWLLPNLECGIILYRALYPTSTLHNDDIKYIYSVMEDTKHEPKPVEDYLSFLLTQIKSIKSHNRSAIPEAQVNIIDEFKIKQADIGVPEDAVIEHFKDVWSNNPELEQNICQKMQALKNIRQQLEDLQQQSNLINEKAF